MAGAYLEIIRGRVGIFFLKPPSKLKKFLKKMGGVVGPPILLSEYAPAERLK